MRSLSYILVLIMGFSTALFAQKDKGAWSDLNQLKSGQGIEVVETSMKSHKGRFVTFTDDALSLQEKGSEIAIKREDIVRVSRASGPKRGEHALIGLAIGIGIGAGIGAIPGPRSNSFFPTTRGDGALVGAVIGGPSGALIGAVVPASTVIYRASPQKPPDKSSAKPQ